MANLQFLLADRTDLRGSAPVPAVKLATPAMQQPTASGYNSIPLSWSGVSNPSPAAYRVQRATDAGFSQNLAVAYEGPNLNATDTTVAGSTTYYYRAMAVGNGTSTLDSDYSSPVSVTTPTAPPPAPTGLTVAPDGTVNWNMAAGKSATDYEYRVGESTTRQTAPSNPFSSGAAPGTPIRLRLKASGATPASLEAVASSNGIQYAADFIAAVQAAGGVLNMAQQSSLYALESDLKTKGFLSNSSRAESWLKAAYPLIGGTSTTHRFNFVDPTQFSLVFYGSPNHNANGVQFNGVNQYADTQFSAYLLPVNSNHMSFYADQAVSDPDRAGQGVMGTALDQYDGLFLAFNRGTNSYYVAGGDAAFAAWNQGSARAGLLIGTRTARTAAALYLAGTQVVTSSVNAGGELSGGEIGIGKVSVNGQFSQIPCSFATIGLGLSTTQASDLAAIIQTFQASNNRAR